MFRSYFLGKNHVNRLLETAIMLKLKLWKTAKFCWGGEIRNFYKYPKILYNTFYQIRLR
jgi:hypothetical protein